MATECFQSIQGLCLRVTRLDECCLPPSSGTPCAYVVSDSFITLTLTAELEDPDEFIVKTASGRVCINEIGLATLKRYTVEVTLCNADPDLFNIIGGVNPILDFNDDTVGFEVAEDLGAGSRFALEFWTRVPTDQCASGGQATYLYWLLPCVQNGRVGDLTVENGPLEFSFTADAVPSSSWGVGPFDVVATDEDNTPGTLLSATGSKTALHVQLTTIAPPCEPIPDPVSGVITDPDCGCQDMP